jgi:hypothetical protein
MIHAVNIGETLPEITLEKDHGGNSSNHSWHSKTLEGKVHVLLYMDPDERKEVMTFLDKLIKQNYSHEDYSTVAIVNLAATWMPNAILETMLGKKQKELQNTEFIFDKSKYLIEKWQLKDDASNILVLDKSMKVLYQNKDTLSHNEIEKILKIIKNHI